MNSIARIVAPILVIGAGLGLMALFILTGPQPERKAAKPLPPRVEVIEVIPGDRPAEVEALGTLVAAEQVVLRPEVTGSIRYTHPQLVPGGLVRKGEVLVRIDSRNYRLAVEQQKAQLAKAEFDLSLERGRQRVAKKEWDLLEGSTRGEADAALALRKPHLKNAQAALAAARSALERAQLDVARTTLRAPFDAFVKDEQVEVGQLVGPTNSIATMVGTSAFWVQVSLPLSDLPLISTPDAKGAGGSAALVEQSVGETDGIRREGRVVRLLGELDPQGKTTRVVVEVKDPLNRDSEGSLPLLLGSVVRVRIAGRSLENVYAIPRVALHEDRRVWLAKEDKLGIRDVKVVWRGRNEVYVRGDLGEPARVVVSRLKAPVRGMAVRLEGAASAEAR